MKYTEHRAIEIANYTIEHSSPVRATAKKYGISKSCVFRDLTVILPQVDSLLYEQAVKVLNLNKAERHIRGGNATKSKYGRD